MGEKFYSRLTSLIACFRRQKNFIKDMNTKAPTVADTRWESMCKLSGWIKTNHVDVLAYLDLKKLLLARSPSCWIMIMFVKKILSEATHTFRSLEGPTMMVSQKCEGLENFHDFYVRFFIASGPLSHVDADMVD